MLLLIRLNDNSCIHSLFFQVVPKAILQCTHVAEGHSKAVLSICATDDLLFSGSKGKKSQNSQLYFRLAIRIFNLKKKKKKQQ
jgi:hypothetical protein